MRAGIIWIPLFVVTLSGCVEDSRVAALEKKVSVLEEKLSEVEKSSNELSFKYLLSTEFAGVAYLTPGSTGYSTVRYDLGVMTVAIQDIQPYANGSKVQLRFGNPLAAAINGLKVNIDWGEVDEKGVANNNTARTKEYELVEMMRPNAWTNTTVVLENIPPNKLGFIRVKNVTHKGIRLTL